MRVLALNYEFPPLGGGAGNATAQICRQLARLGCSVEVMTSWFPGCARHEQPDGFTVHRVPALRRRADRSSPVEMASFLINAAVPAMLAAKRFEPDILHVYFGVPTGPLGLLVRSTLGIPYLLSLRGGDVPGFLPGTLGGMHRAIAPLNRRVWRSASVLVANSAGLRDLAQREMGLPVQLVPNGIDLETFTPTLSDRADLPASGRPEEAKQGGRCLRLLFAGRLVEQKGVRHLLEAMDGLHVEAEIVGAGPEEEALRRLAASLGVEQRVRFRGWIGRDSMPAIYRDADVFVFPSFEEGMPNVVLEAMASGLPIVGTDIYGHRGLVVHGENGILVPVGDAAAIRAALRTLAEDASLRLHMGRASRERAQTYSWASTARAYLDLSEKALRPPTAVA